ncbi:response regulator transcription factor [Paenarthrobacter sp. Z7-10]|uniref:response regulator transcription factor n=1 Tax=Paenarthrobacter sp. Z7-10 TaxID=2787635 RepID=UPI0022A935D4|nr:response regulator transcription factor [Paenarthrobacter sp. Z7-10]MCZ2404870.1 response regulator transcription factor [Paenarthrobacter sp. Z7-10]
MRILVVEDEKLLAETLRRGLANQGFIVDLSFDGVSGLWAATENPYDAIILDLMLPLKNGYDVLKDLRERRIWTPVMMLTAKDGEYDQTDAFDLGADDYLTKPFSFLVLVARLRALIRRGAPERPVVLSLGTLTLDPLKRTVHRGRKPIPLTAREYGLLQFLMRRHDQVVSKAEILDNVWDPDFDGGGNVVEVYIGYLRRKIDQPFGLQTVTTVRGMGYQLSADRGAIDDGESPSDGESAAP